MKYIKKRARYEADNVWFDANTSTAMSYNWWVFVKKINGLVVFNNHGYSHATMGHQRKVRALLNTLGITIDLEVKCPKGLQDLESGIEFATSKISENEAALVRGRKANRARRLEAINALKEQINIIKSLSEEQVPWC